MLKLTGKKIVTSFTLTNFVYLNLCFNLQIRKCLEWLINKNERVALVWVVVAMLLRERKAIAMEVDLRKQYQQASYLCKFSFLKNVQDFTPYYAFACMF